MNKLFLSAFVIFSFILYVLNKPSSNVDGKASVAAPPLRADAAQSNQPAVSPAPTEPSQQAALPSAQPTAAPSDLPQQDALPTLPPTAVPTTPPLGPYKDGTYTGPEVDAFYGLVQVQTVIQSGRIENVQFLEYPKDRRTSARINNYAIPYLQQEAIQVQSANVDIITGATLTSEAFMMSLQPTLDKARN